MSFVKSFVSLGGFQTPPTKMSCNTPHHNPKYEILQKNFLWTIPLNPSVESKCGELVISHWVDVVNNQENRKRCNAHFRFILPRTVGVDLAISWITSAHHSVTSLAEKPFHQQVFWKVIIQDLMHPTRPISRCTLWPGIPRLDQVHHQCEPQVSQTIHICICVLCICVSCDLGFPDRARCTTANMWLKWVRPGLRKGDAGSSCFRTRLDYSIHYFCPISKEDLVLLPTDHIYDAKSKYTFAVTAEIQRFLYAQASVGDRPYIL